MGRGTAFGKTILIGDQFVLDEVPALVSAIPFETVAEVERIAREGWVLEDNRIEVPGYKEQKKEQQVGSINRVLRVMGIDVKKTPLKITYGGPQRVMRFTLVRQLMIQSVARAVNDEFDLGYSIEQINHVGWEGEFPYHGTPSGVDNTASTYGGLLLYWLKDGEKHFERIEAARPLHCVLGNSGITANTAALDDHVDIERERDPALFASRLETITAQAHEMRAAIEAGDLETVGAIMTENHRILIDMDLSHEILITLCNLALEMGALGAKLTGGGRGGYMNALCPNPEVQGAIASRMEAVGYKVIRTTIGKG